MKAEDFNDAGVGNLIAMINMTHRDKVRRERKGAVKKAVPDLVTYDDLPRLLDYVRQFKSTRAAILRARLGLDPDGDGRARSPTEAAETVFPGCNAANLAREVQANFRESINDLMTLMEGKKRK